MDIAVIIPCFNHANVLRRTLDGLLKQTLKPREVVIVDDGSEDHPESIARAYESSLPISFVRFDKNRGAPAARNEGFRRTRARFVLFLDADAVLVPDALEVFSKTLESNPSAAFAYANFYWGAKGFRGQPFDVDALKRRNFIHTTSLLRREAFPGFDESIKKFQDWDLWLTMAEKGLKGIWIDRYLFRVQPRKQGMSRWLPKIAHLIPWQRLGFIPKEIANYREAEKIVRTKHRI